jgi:hypothetical protein
MRSGEQLSLEGSVSLIVFAVVTALACKREVLQSGRAAFCLCENMLDRKGFGRILGLTATIFAAALCARCDAPAQIHGNALLRHGATIRAALYDRSGSIMCGRSCDRRNHMPVRRRAVWIIV